MTTEIKLKGITNVKILEKFQKTFLKLTGLYTTFIDTEGNFITSDRGLRPYCLLLAKFGFNHKCDESNLAACKEVIKIKKPIIYECFSGLTEIISPIIVNNKVLGAVLTGQIRTEGQNIKLSFAKSLSKKEISYLKKEYEKVPILSKEQINSAAELLFDLINYIVKIEYEVLIYKELEEYETRTKEIVRNTLELINKNYSQNISLNSIAEQLCISPFYLSHVFKKETGFSIKEYLTKVRLEHAVKLLKDPSIPIKQIPYKIGFNDIYYFFKVFKKIFQTTPANFRKQYLTK
jgi:ligand-binding sensor protein/AraC-like DNA-binding protein